MAAPPEDEVKQGAPEWVVTFGDMMSLLLCFFVLLLSFSTMEMEKFKVIAGFMREAFGLQTEHNYTGVPMGTTILSTDARRTTTASPEMDLVREVRAAMQEAGMGKRGSVEVTESGVIMRLEGETLFDSGEAELKPEARELLDRIADIASKQPGTVEVEGHSDDVPISSSKYPSNWELSSARAGAAARYLVDRGVESSRIKAVGYADTRPVAPNINAENRAKNRRVEFLFHKAPGEASGKTPVIYNDADTVPEPKAKGD